MITFLNHIQVIAHPAYKCRWGFLCYIVLKTRTPYEKTDLPTLRYCHRSLNLGYFLALYGYCCTAVYSARSSKLKTTFEFIQLAFVRIVNGCHAFLELARYTVISN